MDEDLTLTEKRVYAGGEGAEIVLVASATGLARVSVSDDIVGEFSLEYSGPTTAVASEGGRVAISTPEDVFIDAEGFHGTGFGAANALGYRDGLVATDGERLARYEKTWRTLTELEGIRSIDGELLAASSGVHRLDGTHLGLEDVYDVSSVGTPLAATDEGVYTLANGWVCTLEEACRVVSSDGSRTHAASPETLYERSSQTWTPLELPVEGSVVDIAYGDATYAVTEDGVFLANAGEGFRHRSLGLSGVRGIAVL